MDRKKANELVSRLGMEFELASLLDSNDSYNRFEKIILNVLEKDPPRSVSGFGRNRWRSSYDPYRGKAIPKKTVENPRFERAREEFKEFYGIGSSPKPASVIGKERNLSGQMILYDIELIEMILSAKYKQDIWYGTI